MTTTTTLTTTERCYVNARKAVLVGVSDCRKFITEALADQYDALKDALDEGRRVQLDAVAERELCAAAGC